MFAALNTAEPSIVDLGSTMLLERDKTGHEGRLPVLQKRVVTGWTNCPTGLMTPTGSTMRPAPVTC
jgi:hypothetical protein